MVERFDEALRRWVRRPLRTKAREAARRVVAAIEQRRNRASSNGARLLVWRTAAAIAVVSIVVTVAYWGSSLRTSRPAEPAADPTPPAAVGAPEVLPQDDNIVIWWLDERTPVYFVMQPERRTR